MSGYIKVTLIICKTLQNYSGNFFEENIMQNAATLHSQGVLCLVTLVIHNIFLQNKILICVGNFIASKVPSI
jgi:hypothetical protein